MIIDTHGHVIGRGYPLGTTFDMNADMVLSAMEKYDIGQIWLSHIDAMVLDDTTFNRVLYTDYIKDHPEKMVGYCVVNPYKGSARCRDEIRRCVQEYGFRAIKVHSWLQAFGIHQQVFYDIMAAAEDYRLPVMFHDGTPPYADTSQIAGVAEMFPRVKVLLGHAGLYDSYRSAILATQMLDNVYLCLVGNTIGSIREILKYARRERILFGSDYFLGATAEAAQTLIKDRYDALLEAAEDENVDDILFGNARQIII